MEEPISNLFESNKTLPATAKVVVADGEVVPMPIKPVDPLIEKNGRAVGEEANENAFTPEAIVVVAERR